MKKVIILLIAFSFQSHFTQKLYGSDKTSLVQDVYNNASNISNIVKSNISPNETPIFFNELKAVSSEENARLVIKKYLGESNSAQFLSNLDNMLNASYELRSLNITQAEFDEIVAKINPNKDDLNISREGCLNPTVYQQCISPCNGARAWASHTWNIIWTTTGGVGSGAALGTLFGGVGAPFGALAGGLYGFYEGWEDVGNQYGDCITKCYDKYCRGVDNGREIMGGGGPGGGYQGGDNTAK